ncbi:hypothetical protein MKZ38_004453 [Zalerion maritima]|uniref:Uncharacterized protein n=1 Tax=Zalerion maritima TaxID=339359 RepID=A0AAD5WWF8_9PEZI|nr:hypothetical protein MKZ38_004453 [Zalerion maritima]
MPAKSSFLSFSRNQRSSPSAPTLSTASPSLKSSSSSPSLERRKNEKFAIVFEHPSHTQDYRTSITIGKMDRLHLSSPPRTTTIVTRPILPSSPVEIPPARNETVHNQKQRHCHHHHGRLHLRQPGASSGRSRSQPRQRSHKVEDLPPSVASLLAVTSIPPPASRRRGNRRASKDKRMTVDSIIEQTQVTEKTLSLTLGKSPMELLLSSPEDLEDGDELSISDSNADSTLSTRTISLESMPSLVDSVSTTTLSSLESPFSPASRRCRPTRMSLEPLTAPGEKEDHPLFTPDMDVGDLDFRVFRPDDEEEADTSMFRPLRSAFKSNLTASLKALRLAAKSFSSLNFTSIPPEDFLTRSLLTLDPTVPYTDERRPPVMASEPPAALRRYLNPMTPREDSRLSTPNSPTTRSFTASIQMQTYKVHRTRGLSQPSARMPHSASEAATSSSTPSSSQSRHSKSSPFSYPPGPRALRENSDFIRIAVMEMAMRRQGKLSDETPGHARLALPPRKAAIRQYEVGSDGVPLRWIPSPA